MTSEETADELALAWNTASAEPMLTVTEGGTFNTLRLLERLTVVGLVATLASVTVQVAL